MEYNLDFYVEDFKKQIVDTYKAAIRAEDLVIKEQELNIKKAHNEKMEGMAQAQLESQYRSKQTAKYAKKQAKISQSIKDCLQ